MIAETIVCSKCHQERSIAYEEDCVCPEICNECLSATKKANKDGYLNELKTWTVEERLAFIEEWIYDSREKDYQARKHLDI